MNVLGGQARKHGEPAAHVVAGGVEPARLGVVVYGAAELVGV